MLLFGARRKMKMLSCLRFVLHRIVQTTRLEECPRSVDWTLGYYKLGQEPFKPADTCCWMKLQTRKSERREHSETSTAARRRRGDWSFHNHCWNRIHTPQIDFHPTAFQVAGADNFSLLIPTESIRPRRVFASSYWASSCSALRRTLSRKNDGVVRLTAL